MNSRHFFSTTCALCIVLCALSILPGSAKTKAVALPIGPFVQSHTDFPISIHLDDYPEFSPLERNCLGIFDGNRQLPSQLDDLNGDGTPDCLSFLIDIEAGQRLALKMKPQKQVKEFEKEVHAEMFLKSKTPKEGFTFHEAEGKQFYISPVTEQVFNPGEDSYHMMHHHGVAFESSLMAYRIYFDKKQTIDVYAKKTPRLELEDTKWYPNPEQLSQGYGDDILRVSGYIGVGACKPFNGEKMIHFDDVNNRIQRILADGPIRTVCEIEDSGWLLNNGKRVSVITRYTLYARHRDVQVEVFFSEPVENMCTGVQKIGTPSYFSAVPAHYVKDENTTERVCRNGAIVASWGTDWPVNDTIHYAKETVGLAVFVPELDYKAHVTDKNNNLILLQSGTYLRYWFTCVSQKEENPPVKTQEDFFRYVQEWAASLEE